MTGVEVVVADDEGHSVGHLAEQLIDQPGLACLPGPVQDHRGAAHAGAGSGSAASASISGTIAPLLSKRIS